MAFGVDTFWPSIYRKFTQQKNTNQKIMKSLIVIHLDADVLLLNMVL